jgi:CTP-dependent riboflavin kinase
MMERAEQETLSARLEIFGRVVDGAGKAAQFTLLDWVQEQCYAKLGFRPYPGTLNLEVAEKSLPVVELLRKEDSILLVPPAPEYCAAKVLPLSVGTISGALIIPEASVNIHDKKIIEVLAPVKLKDALGLSEGERVTLNIIRQGV